MATKSFLEKYLSCPVCCEVFKDPVVMACSHSACKDCLKTFWQSKGSKECPTCRRSSNGFAPRSHVLNSLCATIAQVSHPGPGATEFCRLHKEKHKLFCVEDERPVCVVCQVSKKHSNHKFQPVDEAAFDRKRDLIVKLDLLRNTLKTFEGVKRVCDQTTAHIETQAQHTEEQIREEFEKLHQFLRDEEATRIAALREEEKQKRQMMKEKIEKMSREISSLSDTIRAIEDQIRADDITFLQNFKCTMKKAHPILKDPERVSGTLINVAKHLGNLKVRVWEKMQEIVHYTPVTLDPNTAHPDLILSKDLTSVRRGDERQKLPYSPERFDMYMSVLGSEGFDSGTHCWDVAVGDGMWSVGVMTESLWRKGLLEIVRGRWYVFYKDRKYRAHSPPSPPTLLTVRQKLQRIRVQLDCTQGKVSFYDPEKNTHLHTVRFTVTERVFPYFNTNSPLRILPAKNAECLKQHS